jgi:hypothetical protein
VTLPDQPGVWPAGFWTVSAVVTDSKGAVRTSNALALSIAPRIVDRQPQPAPRDSSGTATLTITVSPPVWAPQRAALLVGDQEFVSDSHASAARASTLTFKVTLPAGTYPLRLRIDGVDSFIVKYDVPLGHLPVFDTDPLLSVTLT